ncbi:hypothetical protein AALB52_19535 [Lachnospiraceae bacterium 38-14]
MIIMKHQLPIPHILFILKTSILYTACLAAASMIPFLGHITWSNKWGKIWGTLGKTNIIYFGNKMTAKSMGTFIGALIAVLDICVSNDWLDWAYGFSPVSLTQLELFNGFAPKWGNNLAYAEKFFMIAIVSLSVLCVAANYKEKVISRISRRHIYGR